MATYQLDITLHFETDDPERDFDKKRGPLTEAIEREGFTVSSLTLDAATSYEVDRSDEEPDYSSGDWKSFG